MLQWNDTAVQKDGKTHQIITFLPLAWIVGMTDTFVRRAVCDLP
jgi:hypothetical protein